MAIQPWIIPVVVIETAQATAVGVIIISVVFHFRTGIDRQGIYHIRGTRMELDDVIAQRVGTDLGEITTKLSTTIILIYIAVTASNLWDIGCSALNHLIRALRLLHALIWGEVEIILSGYAQRYGSEKEC